MYQRKSYDCAGTRSGAHCALWACSRVSVPPSVPRHTCTPDQLDTWNKNKTKHTFRNQEEKPPSSCSFPPVLSIVAEFNVILIVKEKCLKRVYSGIAEQVLKGELNLKKYVDNWHRPTPNKINNNSLILFNPRSYLTFSNYPNDILHSCFFFFLTRIQSRLYLTVLSFQSLLI